MDGVSYDFYLHDPSLNKIRKTDLYQLNPKDLIRNSTGYSGSGKDCPRKSDSSLRREHSDFFNSQGSIYSVFESSTSLGSQKYFLLARNASRKRNVSFIDWLTLYTQRERESKEKYYNKVLMKPMQTFQTGSKYIGEQNRLGFCGKGIYRYPHGVIYDGYFNRDAQFHGVGKLIYPRGQIMEGVWKNGVLQPGATIILSNGKDVSDNYCRMPDRRFNVEITGSFGGVGQEYLTDQQPTREIPDGWYDVGEGFYNPKSKCILNPMMPAKVMKTIDKFQCPMDDEKQLLIDQVNENSDDSYLRNQREVSFVMEDWKIQEIGTKKKERWIKNHCRKAWDEPTGYRPDLFERWTTGKKISGEGTHEVSDLTLLCSSPELHGSIDLSDKQNSSKFVSFIYKPKRKSLYEPRGKVKKENYSTHSQTTNI